MKLLSIVIPTRNRYQYLKKCVELLERLDSSLVEILISDNSDDNSEFKRYLATNSFDNINYFYTKERMSQTENSEFAVERATGEYICFIGDDDLVLPSMIDLARRMKSDGNDACLFDIPKYYWPDLVENLKGHEYLSYKEPTFKTKRINSRQALKREVLLGCQNITPLPRVYHGLVSKNLLNEVKSFFGAFFPGPSPDMANAVAVSYLAKSPIRISFSPMISGFGNNSAGGMGQRGKHAGPLKGNFQLRDDIEDSWNNKIPKIWLGSTIYAFSAYSALSCIKDSKLYRKINYGAVFFEVRRFKEYKPLIKECKPSIKDFFGMLRYLFAKIVKKLFIKEKFVKVFDYCSIDDAFLLLSAKNALKADEKRCG